MHRKMWVRTRFSSRWWIGRISSSTVFKERNALHLGEPLVAAHHFGGVHPLRGKRRANDMQPVEGGFRREIPGYAAAGRRNKPRQWESQRNIQAVIF